MDVEFGFLPNERTRFKPQSLKKGAPQTAELAKDLAGFRAAGHAGGEATMQEKGHREIRDSGARFGRAARMTAGNSISRRATLADANRKNLPGERARGAPGLKL